MLKKILWWFLVVIALIQFIPIDRANKPIKKSENFVDLFHTPQNIREILKTACYDCHSNETVYPKYAYVAPISWAVKDHVNEGREHLNFSEWGRFNKDLKRNMLEHSVQDLKNSQMPIPGYVAQHPKANLTAAQRKLMVEYFEEMLKSGEY